MSENVAYYVIKLPSVRFLSNIQNRNICGISPFLEIELNAAYAQSSFVVIIFSIMGTNTFDGYCIMRGVVGDSGGNQFNTSDYPPGSNMRPLCVQLIRRGTIGFNQVGHIRDDIGLQGRSVSTARDGVRLGPPSGRVLCRSIDKRAYKDDPIHYKDDKYVPRVISDSAYPSVMRCSKQETDFLIMDYEQYKQWYTDNMKEGDKTPSLDNIVFR